MAKSVFSSLLTARFQRVYTKYLISRRDEELSIFSIE